MKKEQKHLLPEIKDTVKRLRKFPAVAEHLFIDVKNVEIGSGDEFGNASFVEMNDKKNLGYRDFETFLTYLQGMEAALDLDAQHRKLKK